ncbi:MAG: hypothetical protein DRH37_06625 [Deltaproteobacteria bacterium]|nr:MAG: hypothetical protein DRH37_06625 [Deltaproteobacteria bacterium]
MKEIDNVKQFLKDHKPDLSISRVPKKTLEIFKQLAKDEFANDYGMTLKYLVDYAIRDAKYMELSQRLLILEEKVLSEKKKTIKTLSGKVIKEVE